MTLFNNLDQDTILWFIILFLLLFWCGNNGTGVEGSSDNYGCGC